MFTVFKAWGRHCSPSTRLGDNLCNEQKFSGPINPGDEISRRKCLLSRAGKLHSKKATLLHSTNGIRTTRSFAAFESRTYALSTTVWFTDLKHNKNHSGLFFIKHVSKLVLKES